MTCTCLRIVNAQLAPDHLLYAKRLKGGDRPIIPLVRRDTYTLERRRKKTHSMLPTFCPFCGTRYEAFYPPCRPGDGKEPTHG